MYRLKPGKLYQVMEGARKGMFALALGEGTEDKNGICCYPVLCGDTAFDFYFGSSLIASSRLREFILNENEE